MVEINRFRDDHQKLLDFIKQISQNLDADELSKDAKKVKKLIFDFIGHLHVHLLVEDKALYPQLLKYPNETIKLKAEKFIKEMGNISQEVVDYKHKWTNAFQIQKNPQEFIEDTNNIISILSKRIEREDNDLYDLIDELESTDKAKYKHGYFND